MDAHSVSPYSRDERYARGARVDEQDSDLTPYRDSDALIDSTLGGFRLTSLLGTGGMAEVYRGYDLQLQRDVAVKVLPGHVARDPRYVARFRNEAQRVAALRHPNVVPIFHFGEERGLLYLVMPILKESLRDRMTREGTLDPLEAIFLTVEVAQALDAAHSQGIVHRDVKPENILLNDEGRPLLTDFGIAREVEVLRDSSKARTLATTGMPVGTPAYMAPELLRGAPADHRVDVYGLGVALYEMITGRLPHEGITAFDVAARALTEVPLPPSEHNPGIWPALDEVVLGAMASDPDQRYPDMSSLVEALREAALARGTGSARPVLPAPVRLPRRDEAVTVAGTAARAWQDQRGPTRIKPARWLDTIKAGGRRRAMAMVAAAIVLVLALVASGAGGVLYALHTMAPTNAGFGSGTAPATDMPTIVPTGITTTGPGVSPSVQAGHTPTVSAPGTGVPTPSPTAPGPTATPLLTPTMVVSADPLNFQPYPSPPLVPKNCVATQKLTNISAVDAEWSWTNAPGASGWQYNTSGFGSSTWTGWPPTLTMTTPPNSSVYIYIKTGYDTNCNTKTPLVATISVTEGTGTQFNVRY